MDSTGTRNESIHSEPHRVALHLTRVHDEDFQKYSVLPKNIANSDDACYRYKIVVNSRKP